MYLLWLRLLIHRVRQRQWTACVISNTPFGPQQVTLTRWESVNSVTQGPLQLIHVTDLPSNQDKGINSFEQCSIRVAGDETMGCCVPYPVVPTVPRVVEISRGSLCYHKWTSDGTAQGWHPQHTAWPIYAWMTGHTRQWQRQWLCPNDGHEGGWRGHPPVGGGVIVSVRRTYAPGLTRAHPTQLTPLTGATIPSATPPSLTLLPPLMCINLETTFINPRQCRPLSLSCKNSLAPGLSQSTILLGPGWPFTMHNKPITTSSGMTHCFINGLIQEHKHSE